MKRVSSISPGWVLAFAVMAGVIAFFYWIQRTPDNNVAWAGQFETAAAEASDTGRPMLLYFTADWCPPCQQMKRETWPRPDVEQAVNQRLIALHLDVDDESVAPLATRYRVQYIPTLIFTDAEGRILEDAEGSLAQSGFISAERMLRLIDRAEAAVRADPLAAGR